MYLVAGIVLAAAQFAVRGGVLKIEGEIPQCGPVYGGDAHGEKMPKDCVVVLQYTGHPLMISAVGYVSVCIVPAVLAVLAAELAVLPSSHGYHGRAALEAVRDCRGGVVLVAHRASVLAQICI